MTSLILKLINTNSGKILNNIIWLLLDKGVKMVLGLFIGIWIARYLGPEQFGKLNYGQAFVAIFSSLVNLGLDTTLVKEFVSKDFAENKLIGTGFLLRLYGAVVGILLAVLTALMLEFNTDQLSFLIITALSIGLIFQAVDVIDLYLQAHLKSRISVIIKNLSYLFSSIFKVYLIIYNFPVIYFAIAIVFDLGLASILMLIYSNKKLAINLKDWMWDLVVAKTLLKTSWPLIISGLTVIMYMRMDQIMLKNYLGSFAVGNYSAAARVTELFFILPMVISNSVFPSLVKCKDDILLYRNRLIKLYSTLIYISILLSISILFFSNYIINILYGQQYQDAVSVLNIHIWSSIFVFIGVASSQQLVLEGRSSISLYRTVLGLATNLILNIILIPTYGIKGAAFATLVSYAVSSFFSNFLFKSTRGIIYLYLRSLLPFKKTN
ncbi:O-antigen/teichoic acid export membrane protein [Pontibacter aydingkolensis]|uniref:Flippase n=1 Tax=Pontibacter aydingkolensis TaxID=1911536 RepID=A0ABS7CYZ4_9BACT|nr:flippase [Pontibacter aydingkolensis]MBW7469039.1 flippase [Pontibacter aydingkolensis]